MGISHDYHSTGRRRRGGPGGVIRFAGAVAGILLVSFACCLPYIVWRKKTQATGGAF